MFAAADAGITVIQKMHDGSGRSGCCVGVLFKVADGGCNRGILFLLFILRVVTGLSKVADVVRWHARAVVGPRHLRLGLVLLSDHVFE